MARQFLNYLEIVIDPRKGPKPKLKYNGKTVFEVNDDRASKKKEIEFIPVNNFSNPNKEYIVEIPLKKNTTVINQLQNSINMQSLINSCDGMKILLILNSPDFDV